MWRKIVYLFMVLFLAAALSLPALAAEPSPTASPGPSGMRTSSWAEPACTQWCIEQGLLPEDADLTAPATCAQVVELLGWVETSGGVAVGARQGKVLAWRCGTGTLFGIPGFAPDKDITRQELAALLYGWMGSPEYVPVTQDPWHFSAPLADGEDIAPYAAQAAVWARGTGFLFMGYQDGELYFCPDRPVTLEELAMVLAKLHLWEREKLDLSQVEEAVVMKSFGAPANIVRLKDPEDIQWIVEKLNAYEPDALEFLEPMSTGFGYCVIISLKSGERLYFYLYDEGIRVNWSGATACYTSQNPFSFEGIPELFESAPTGSPN